MALVLLVLLCAVAVVLDLRERRIPNWLTVGGLVTGLALAAVGGGASTLDALAATGVAFALGVLLFATRTIAGGDAKLLMAVAPFLGMDRLLPAIAVAGVVGGVLAVFIVTVHGRWASTGRNLTLLAMGAAVDGRKGLASADEAIRAESARVEAPTIPYGVAIAVGSLVGWWL